VQPRRSAGTRAQTDSDAPAVRLGQGTPQAGLLDALYKGEYEDYVECRECGYCPPQRTHNPSLLQHYWGAVASQWRARRIIETAGAATAPPSATRSLRRASRWPSRTRSSRRRPSLSARWWKACSASSSPRRWTGTTSTSEPAVSILESIHIDCDLPISRRFLSRNIEDGNGRAGARSARRPRTPTRACG
jgi:hypothetical protein